ncbi:hypothetical protein F5880DRAFT_1682849 [Lentinula raphanica]|nr:hypothetical protein F5880DRAFT_1682849 [Lentinula raphanica]
MIHQLNAITTVGPTGLLAGFIGPTNSSLMLEKFYKKDIRRHVQNLNPKSRSIANRCVQYSNRIFKIPQMDRWVIIVSGRELIEDLMKAPDSELSMIDAAAETLQLHLQTIYPHKTVREYFCGPATFLIEGPDRLGQGTGLQNIFPDRRDPDWLDLNTNFAVELFIMRRANHHLRPIIEERLAKEEEYKTKDWPGKPNDLILWLLEEAKGEQRMASDLIMRVLAVEVAAIHTTSTVWLIILSTFLPTSSSPRQASCNALYQLAAHPEVVAPLRDTGREPIYAICERLCNIFNFTDYFTQGK